MLLSSGMDIHAYSSGSLPSRLEPLQALQSLSMGAFVCAIIHPCDLALEDPLLEKAAKNSQHEPLFKLLEIWVWKLRHTMLADHPPSYSPHVHVRNCKHTHSLVFTVEHMATVRWPVGKQRVCRLTMRTVWAKTWVIWCLFGQVAPCDHGSQHRTGAHLQKKTKKKTKRWREREREMQQKE